MRTYVAIGITAVWAVSYIGSILSSDFTGFEVSTPVMLIAATYLLSLDLKRRNGKNGNGAS